MTLRITCPGCSTVNSASDDRRGQRIRCTSCDKSISVPEFNGKHDDEDAFQESPRVKVMRKPSNDEDDRRPPTRKAKPAKQGGAPILLILVAAGAVAALLLCVVGVGGGAFFLLRSRPEPANQAKHLAKFDRNQDEQPQPANLKLTDAHIKFAWSKNGDRHVLTFEHGQPHDLTNVRITIHWFQAGYNSQASQQLNWGVWRANETKQQIMAVRERPTAIRIVGLAAGPNAAAVEIDCPIPDPKFDPNQEEKPKVIKLTNAHIKFAWNKNADRHVLSFNHGQPHDLTNVQITIHWFQAGFNSQASQGRNWPVWRANESKQQIMAVRERPTAIRIVGQAAGPNAARYEIDCLIPDPP